MQQIKKFLPTLKSAQKVQYMVKCSVRANTPFQRTEQNRTICQVLFGSYEQNIYMFGPNRTEHLQYGYQIKWSWAATCEKLVNFDLSSLLKKVLL